MESKDLEMIEEMEKYGGSFVKALAVCLRCADSSNYQILVNAFSKYIKDYSK